MQTLKRQAVRQPARVQNIQPRATVRTSNVVVPSLVTRQFPACSKMLLTRAITPALFFQIPCIYIFLTLHFLFDQHLLANQTYLQNLAGKVAEIIKEIKENSGACLVAVSETGFLFSKQRNTFQMRLGRLGKCFENKNQEKHKIWKHL